MRQGELLRLDWKNVSLERLTIYILEAKSGKPREVPITNKLREVLETLGPKREGSVFDLPKITLRRHFEKAMAGAHIAGFRFHDLRHTFASHFIMRTNDLPALQRLLGHSTPAMTLRYAHLSNGHMAANMATFEAGMPAKGWNPVQDMRQNCTTPLNAHTAKA
jgi:integrase